mmetsp:Transcript_12142/g.40014  ORF Transcript_12142/g.40014 Transcript_12142/m.40014 type:complete len:207 (-) Transcript_12142:210-830(-)
MALSWPRIRLMCPHASMGERRSSATSRSILLRTRSEVTPSSHACRSTAAVCTHTPSTTSTTSSAPSLSRTAEETSEQKSTWPGESIRLTRSGLAASAPPPAAATSAPSTKPCLRRRHSSTTPRVSATASARSFGMSASITPARRKACFIARGRHHSSLAVSSAVSAASSSAAACADAARRPCATARLAASRHRDAARLRDAAAASK